MVNFRKMAVLGVVFFVCFFFTSYLLAVPPAKKFKHADRNKDGVVDRKEFKMEKRFEQKQKSQVNTWWEDK